MQPEWPDRQPPHPASGGYQSKPLFDGNPALAEATAFRGSSLQEAYLMLAARSLGLDCGPMSGFDAEAVNREFFPEGR